jgi:hypothetical protein
VDLNKSLLEDVDSFIGDLMKGLMKLEFKFRSSGFYY